MFSLQNKTALVTGGASGIGLAIAQIFAQAGATVHILELNREQTQRVADEITAGGGSAFAHAVDVSKQADVLAVVDHITGLGPISILVNNAGIAHVGTVETTTEADLDQLYSVNVKGVYNCLNAVIPRMKAAGGGVILNMASIASSVGLAERFAYSMSKGAVLGMTLSVARDYVNDNIRCNCMSPARVHTPFVDGFIARNYPGKEEDMFARLAASQPIGRMGEPREIGALALFLCSDEAGFITGCDYPIDGGFIRLNT